MKRVLLCLGILTAVALLVGCGPRFWAPSTPDIPTGDGAGTTPEGILFEIAVWCIWAGGLALALAIPAAIWLPVKRTAASIAFTGAGLVAGGVLTQFFANNLWLIACGSGLVGVVYVLRRNPNLAGKLENALPGRPDIPGIGPDQDKVVTEKIEPGK